MTCFPGKHSRTGNHYLIVLHIALTICTITKQAVAQNQWEYKTKVMVQSQSLKGTIYSGSVPLLVTRRLRKWCSRYEGLLCKDTLTADQVLVLKFF